MIRLCLEELIELNVNMHLLRSLVDNSPPLNNLLLYLLVGGAFSGHIVTTSNIKVRLEADQSIQL